VRPFLENTGQAFPWSYFGFFPTVNIACDLSETSQFGIEMGRQIGRPWIWDVNPFPSFTDPRFLNIGNPYLRPSYTNNIGFNYSKYLGKQSLNFSLFGSYSTAESTEITSINSTNGVLISTPQNLGNSYSGGFDFNGNFNFLKYFSLNSSVNVYYEAMNADKIDKNLSYSTIGTSSSMYFNYKSKFGLSANLGFHFWYAARDIQGRTIPNVWHWMSVTQNLYKDKLRMTISTNNPFFLNRWTVYTNTEFTKGYSRSIWENRVLNLRVSYNFGKTAVKKQRASRLEGRAGSDARGQSGPMK
jgi:outer membrane receptor protein involved in Fe transport